MLKTKSLLPSHYKGVRRFAEFGKEGLGEVPEEYVWSIMDSLVTKMYVDPAAANFSRIKESLSFILRKK